jgi:hypothetical protein
MTRKTSQILPEDPRVKPPTGSSSQVHSVAPLKPTKLSLESLLAETPENNRDEAWEKMASEGKEF